MIKAIAYWLMIIAIFALGIYVIHWTKSQGYECLHDPYTYSIKLLEKANGAPVQAIITVMKPNGAKVLLTRDGFSAIQTESNYTPWSYNFSSLNLT